MNEKELDKLIKEVYKDKEFIKENLKITKEWECALMDGLDTNERWEEFYED